MISAFSDEIGALNMSSTLKNTDLNAPLPQNSNAYTAIHVLRQHPEETCDETNVQKRRDHTLW